MALAFGYGIATIKWKVFPYRFLTRIEAGVVALTKFEDTRFPQHVIRSLADATAPDPVALLADSRPDDLILMTGGFFYRMDLCPDFGCIAYVIDRDGTVLHTWEADPTRMFTEETLAAFSGFPGAQNINVQGIAIGPDGALTVTFQGRNVFPYQIAVAQFDWEGDLRWIRINKSHHWPSVGPDGRVYVPIARIKHGQGFVAGTKEKLDCRFGAVFQEGVAILSPEGRTLREFWMEDVVKAHDMQGLAYAVRDDCDPYHVNHVSLLNEAAAARMPGTRRGDLLVSLRSTSSLVVLDQDTGMVITVLFGPMVAQHSAVPLPDGSIAMFDNLGGIDTLRGTRILRIVPNAPGLGSETLFPRHKTGTGANLLSVAQGAVRFSKDGTRGLIAETLGGRVIEFDVKSGQALWSMRSISDLSPYLEWLGETPGGPEYALLQTQGADYVSRADVERWSRDRLVSGDAAPRAATP